MSNQQSMFAEPEHQPPEQRIENMDPREQQGQEFREEYPVYGEEAYHAQRGGAKVQPRQRPRRRFGLPLVAVLVILGVLLLGGGMTASHEASRWGDNEHRHPMMQALQQISVSSGEKVVVQSEDGNVRLHAGADGVVQLNTSEDGNRVNYSQNGNTLVISVGENGGFSSDSTDVDVTLPQTSNVQVESHSGSVVLSDLNGSVQVNTTGGDILGSNLQGDVTLQTTSGEIHVEGFNGKANLSTGSGDIEVNQGNLTGDSSFSSDGGNISYNGALASGYHDQFVSSNGDVSLSLPADASVSVKTQTGSGDVRNDFSNAPSGSSSANVTVTTSSGDITIQRNS